MSKTRKVRRARKALERAEEAKLLAETKEREMREATAGIRNKWGLVVEHMGSILGNETVLNALIHGPKHHRSPQDRLRVHGGPRDWSFNPDRGADMATIETMRIYELTDLIVAHQESFKGHCMVVRHYNNEAALMLTREALFSTPRHILVEDVAKKLVDHIRQVHCDY